MFLHLNAFVNNFYKTEKLIISIFSIESIFRYIATCIIWSSAVSEGLSVTVEGQSRL